MPEKIAGRRAGRRKDSKCAGNLSTGVSSYEKRKEKYLLISHTFIPKSLAIKFAGLFTGMFTRPAILITIAVAVALFTYGLLYGGLTNPLNLNVVIDARVSDNYSLLAIIFTVFVSFFFHELGHSSAALKYGADVRGIGVGIYWIFPVLYSDVTTVWRLPPPKRLIVDVAGVYFQCVAILAMEVFTLIPIGSGFHETLAICIVYNSIVVLVNLNPILRYDGYWMFSDFFNIPNLRQQTNEFTWKTVAGFFKKGDVDEVPPKARILAVYAFISLTFSIIFIMYLSVAVFDGYSQWSELPYYMEMTYLHFVQDNYSAGIDSVIESIKIVVPIVLFPILIVLSLTATLRTFVLSGKTI